MAFSFSFCMFPSLPSAISRLQQNIVTRHFIGFRDVENLSLHASDPHVRPSFDVK